MPPVLALTLGIVGAAALARWCVKKMPRVSAAVKSTQRPPFETVDRNALPTLSAILRPANTARAEL